MTLQSSARLPILLSLFVVGCTSEVATVSGPEFMKIQNAHTNITQGPYTQTESRSVVDVQNIDGTMSRVVGSVDVIVRLKDGSVRKYKSPLFVSRSAEGFTIAERRKPHESYRFDEVAHVECRQLDYLKTYVPIMGGLIGSYQLFGEDGGY